ncbi:MAG: nucleotide exchange factor GrpE [Chlamydiae bacterium]|jgi:molecular chaperone GrpE|nr:nucleotide exchange factor GrpE [Chlamydiota bacterium]
MRIPMSDEPIVEEIKNEEPPVDDFKGKYLRALADMENLRKRLQHEKQDSIAYAIDNMLSDFLAPLDSFESALAYTENLSPELKNWAYGFKMIANQFKEVLEHHGIRTYESLGKQFDPHFHEGVETIETEDQKDGSIIEEVVKGYKRGERILRVAKVKVAKRPTKVTEGESYVKEEK